MLENFAAGLGLLLQWQVVLAIAVGMAAGILIGALPGLTATMAVALLVPVTFHLPPLAGIGLLIGVYKGGIYGGSISAILINTPGTPAAAATILDGYPLAVQGKAGKALKMALYASTIGDTLTDLALILVAPPLALLALKLAPPELTALLVFALTIVGAVSGPSILRGLMMAGLGILLSTVGMDEVTGTARFTFGSTDLMAGLAFLPVLLGLFAIPEILVQVERRPGVDGAPAAPVIALSGHPSDHRVSLAELRGVIRTILRSSAIGLGIGAIPGIGSVISSFLAYGLARRYSRRPEEFGRGSLEGVAAAESGNNAVCGATLIPLLSLGIPGDSVTAVLLGAFMIHGIVPGPNLIRDHADVLYGLFLALIVASLLNLLIGYCGLNLYTRAIRLPRSVIFPTILVLCVMGAYAINNSLFDVWVMLAFGLFGYLMRRLEFPLPPFLIAFILGPMLESYLRQSIEMFYGDLTIFLTRPLSAVFLALAALSILVSALRPPRTVPAAG